jgi:hypothetical protein
VRRRATGLAVTLALAALVLAPSSQATTVTLGPPTLADPSADMVQCAQGSCTGDTLMVETVPGATATAPARGRIGLWRFVVAPFSGTGSAGTVRLAVLTGPSAGQVTSRAVGDPKSGGGTMGVPVSLGVEQGDRIGITLMPGTAGGGISLFRAPAAGASYQNLAPFTAAGQTNPAGMATPDEVLQFNADLVLAPVVAALSPASGPAAGGSEVTISGQYLDGATGVTFGATPAQTFVVDSAGQIRATAPAGTPGSAVDVTVTGPGGTSLPSSATRFSYEASPSPPGGASDTTAPRLSELTLSPSAFVAANFGPSIVAARAVGTHVFYKLDEPATATFRVQRATRGYVVKRRCVGRRPARKAKRCTKFRTISGSFTHVGAAGINEFKFLGRIRGRTLRPGGYRLRGVAKDAAGNVGKSLARRFWIRAP